MMMALANIAAKHGEYKSNPFNFEHKNLNSLAVYVDGVQLPTVPYRPDFKSNEWVRLYQDFFRANGQYYGSIAPEVSYEEYGIGHTLFALDFSPDLSALHGGHFNLIKNGSMHINLCRSIACQYESHSICCISKYR